MSQSSNPVGVSQDGDPPSIMQQSRILLIQINSGAKFALHKTSIIPVGVSGGCLGNLRHVPIADIGPSKMGSAIHGRCAAAPGAASNDLPSDNFRSTLIAESAKGISALPENGH